MRKKTGSNIQDVKLKNRILILQLIATGKANTRAELAKVTGLSKMAVTNIVQELILQGFLEEGISTEEERVSSGRPPILLQISNDSPRICGMLIKRDMCQVLISNLSGKMIHILTEKFDEKKMNASYLVECLQRLYDQITEDETHRILAVGISSVGPLNAKTGMILNPPNFYNIMNLNIVEAVESFTHVPVFLMNDANAGALAENLYGKGKQDSDFIYLQLMNGTGAGLVLNGELYDGNFGQSGEIGHTSINFAGPECSCGNIGCLDLYANIENMNRKKEELAFLYPDSPILSISSPVWEDFIDAADRKDPIARIVLTEYCKYVSVALKNLLNFLDVSKVVISYASHTSCHMIEDILSGLINDSAMVSKHRQVVFEHSSFGASGSMIGSIAVVASKVFSLSLPI